MAHDTLYAIGEALIDMIPAETGCDFGAVSSFAPRVAAPPPMWQRPLHGWAAAAPC